jgi:hypothetical protein
MKILTKVAISFVALIIVGLSILIFFIVLIRSLMKPTPVFFTSNYSFPVEVVFIQNRPAYTDGKGDSERLSFKESAFRIIQYPTCVKVYNGRDLIFSRYFISKIFDHSTTTMLLDGNEKERCPSE